MKINVFLTVVFLSVIVYASTKFPTGIVGTTHLNGEGCACHAVEASLLVNVWVEGPDTIALGETAQYTVFMTGGPAAYGGFNAAARFGNLSASNSSVVEIDGELTHAFPLPSTEAQPFSWSFNYTGLSQGRDTIYSVGNSVDGNEIPTNDEWNFGENFPVFVSPAVPVELVSFSAVSENNNIRLSWVTATELNNNGFEIQRSTDKKDFVTVGFVKGNGTMASPNTYSFIDLPLDKGEYFYRLKQVDYDGSFSYSDIVSSEFNPVNFELLQNFPNPFNPSTAISFKVYEDGFLSLKIFNVQGELIEVLSNGIISSGSHTIEWNASAFTSGVYFYQFDFKAASGLKISGIRKMMLMK